MSCNKPFNTPASLSISSRTHFNRKHTKWTFLKPKQQHKTIISLCHQEVEVKFKLFNSFFKLPLHHTTYPSATPNALPPICSTHQCYFLCHVYNTPTFFMKLLHSQWGDLDNKTLLFRNISWRFDWELKTPNNALTQKKVLLPKHWPNAKKRFKIHAHSLVYITVICDGIWCSTDALFYYWEEQTN